MAEPLRGAILGFGNVGQGITRFLHRKNLARIVAVCNRGADKLKLAREQYGVPFVSHDAKEVCQRPDVDFVCVLSTNYAHRDHTVWAAEAGKHIFLEKPIALTLGEADEMVEAVERAGVVCGLNFTNRYLPSRIRLGERLARGDVGKLLSAWTVLGRGFGLAGAGARHRAILEPEESGTWIVHHVCHSVDFLEWMAGPIREVYCRARGTLDGKDSPELVWGMTVHENGVVGSIHDTVGRFLEHLFALEGDRGTLYLKLADRNRDQILWWKEEGDTGMDAARRTPPEVEDVTNAKHPGQGMERFLQGILEGKPPEPTIREARRNLAVTLAMRESARTGKVVAVPA